MATVISRDVAASLLETRARPAVPEKIVGEFELPGSAPAWGCRPDMFVLGCGNATANPFNNTTIITIPTVGRQARTVDVFASDAGRIRRHYDSATDRAIYLLGHAAHPSHRGAVLLRCAAEACVDADGEFLRALVGTFVLIVDDRRSGLVHCAADAMGVRPWFVGRHNDRLVAGSDVLKICAAGLSRGEADYDAIATWLLFNQPLGDATVVTDYKGLPPGTAAAYDSAGRGVSATHYGRLTYADEPITPGELAERQHSAVSGVIDALLGGIDDVHLLLSGGYDSRLLAAMLARRDGVRVRMSTLATRSYETPLARAVAAALNRPLDVVPNRPRIADWFNEPFATTPGGFITGMNLTNALARRHVGTPTICGLMGDGTMRGSVIATSTHFAQEKAGLSESALAAMVVGRFTLHDHRLNLLHAPLHDAVRCRAEAAVRRFIAPGCAAGKPLIYADLYGRHRTYFAGNILQPLDVSEPLAPLASWALADLRTRHPQTSFGRENYPTLFGRFFPALSHIPHAYDVDFEATGVVKPPTPPTRHHRRWATQLAKGVAAGRLRNACCLKTSGRIIVDAFRARPAEEKELVFLYKLQLFEKYLRACRIDFDWKSLA